MAKSYYLIPAYRRMQAARRSKTPAAGLQNNITRIMKAETAANSDKRRY